MSISVMVPQPVTQLPFSMALFKRTKKSMLLLKNKRDSFTPLACIQNLNFSPTSQTALVLGTMLHMEHHLHLC